jgi:hypothetical protein
VRRAVEHILPPSGATGIYGDIAPLDQYTLQSSEWPRNRINRRSLDRNMLYADGAFKLAHVEGPNGLTFLPILANARNIGYA